MIAGTLIGRTALRGADRAVPQNQASRETGYTLVELLIYSSLLVLILTVVGGMLLNTLTAEQKVLDSANANSVSQLISTSVHSGVRNATDLTLSNGADPDNYHQLLVVTTANTDPAVLATARVCQAWYYAAATGGAMYYKRGAAPQTTLTSQALANDMTGWTLLGSGLSATLPAVDGLKPIFSDLTADNSSIALNFAINAGGDSSPALISTTVTSRQSATESTSCF